MKILHIIFTLQYGGAETLLVDMINKQLEKNNVNVFIINKDYAVSLIESIDKRINVITFNRKRGSLNPIKLLKIMKSIYDLSPDVIHCHDSKAIYFVPLCYRKKTLLTVHGTSLALRGLKRYEHIISISAAVAKDIHDRKVVQSTVIYNGINTDEIYPKDDCKNGSCFSIVHVARLEHKVKGQERILEAAAILMNKYNVLFRLDFIGDGSSKDFLKQRIKTLGLTKNVRLLGQKDRQYIYMNISHYDILVQPSLYEGFGLSIAEGMAAKVPVLVSNIEGPVEVINNGEFGFCFKRGDVQDCADKLYYLYTHPQERDLMRNKAFIYCKNNFSLDIMTEKYQKQYEAIACIDSNNLE